MKKNLSIALGLMLLATTIAACSQKNNEPGASPSPSPAVSATDGQTNDSPYKITDEKITLKMGIIDLSNFRPPSKDLWMWKKYEEMTNVHIEWEEMPESNMNERKGILLASNDRPDAFFQSKFTQEELSKYGKQGIVIPLDDLIPQAMPNLTTLMKKDPTIEKAMRSDDGKIYSLPYLESSPVYGSLRYYINKTWLDNVGLDVPKTLDELTAALKAFKEQDANKNGDPNDEVPVYLPSDAMDWTLERQLFGSFGLGNRGNQAASAWIDMGDNGKVRFIPTDPAFKEIWQYLNGLWKDGLIHKDTFTEKENAKWSAAGDSDQVGLFSWSNPGFIGEKAKNNFVGINALVGPNGDKLQSWSDPLVRGIGAFVITKDNPYPLETLKWVDFFYGEEGSNFATIGLENETYVMVDGKPRYIDAIMNDERGVQLGSYQYVNNVFAGSYPYLEPDVNLRAEIKGATVEEDINSDPADMDNFKLEEYWTAFAPLDKETSQLTTILTDLNAYLKESRSKFITGQLNFEADWDKFLQDLEKIGVSRYLEIKQQQFERYAQ
ncbi:extracellular solute-binding protein [Paenibacillus sp. J5C_2022]|uniref:extracellular solute-binding protein n=1 Tax=Paenibacillus sp. J5C2022 TaxID=2977129 RepID=UPI0021D26DD5|nr:extracellular solute-binding protein [Paenibacillus sp. J5C2022]MCU6708057.1 extracellular solute-binding protein [Paenibacillus sp. J5C2022]